MFKQTLHRLWSLQKPSGCPGNGKFGNLCLIFNTISAGHDCHVQKRFRNVRQSIEVTALKEMDRGLRHRTEVHQDVHVLLVCA